MSGYDIYVFALCLIVFAILVGTSSIMLTSIVKLTIKTIKLGAEDEKIKKEYFKAQKIKRKCKGFDFILSLILCLILCVVFAFSIFVGCSGDSYSTDFPTLKVVKSASMATKHEKNTYLYLNELNDQFDTFDLIFTYKLPEEKDLKLYDIVVYEVDGVDLVHRIVGIEEPNEEHPSERFFLLQGDAVERPDRFPVHYFQMKGIYKGERIPFIGSFITFMQSPAGWLCILLVVTAMIIAPILEHFIAKEKTSRLCALGIITNEEVEQEKEQEIIQESQEDSLPFYANFSKDRKPSTFASKLDQSKDIVKDRYEKVLAFIKRIEGIRAIYSKTSYSFKKGNLPIVKMNFRGKTLCANVAHNPIEYEESKYVFIDVSSTKAYEKYPMRLKLTSDRQTRHTIELLEKLVQKSGLILNEEIKEKEEFSFDKLKSKKKTTFIGKLRKLSSTQKERYKAIREHLKSIEGVREIESKDFRTYRKGNKAVAKITIKGKTLNVYLGLNPTDYVESKYVFKDCSSIKKFALYPMRVKLTSDRQVRYTIELINKIVE